MPRYIKRLQEMTRDDVPEAGGKAANLAELARNGFNVPPAFCVTARALDRVLESSGAAARIAEVAASIRYDDYDLVEKNTAVIRDLITEAEVPRELGDEIRAGIDFLRRGPDDDPLAVVDVHLVTPVGRPRRPQGGPALADVVKDLLLPAEEMEGVHHAGKRGDRAVANGNR